MDLSLFDYAFPKELVAQHPPQNREDARMMLVDRAAQTITHHSFQDFLSFIRSGDVVVLNDAQADLVPFGEKLVPALPPYIKRKKAEDFTEEDYARYRSVYAKAPGSKAAPTAGFHFTEKILQEISVKGADVCPLTLHVSYDTYKPIREDNILNHPMHGELFTVPEKTWQAVEQAKKEKRRIIAVGTTSVRALESYAVRAPLAAPGRDKSPLYTDTTSLFITPGYSFKIVDAMLTNFHRPRSTVLVMVSAFAGREFILHAYEEAIREKYRLFSYGDCMLIL